MERIGVVTTDRRIWFIVYQEVLCRTDSGGDEMKTYEVELRRTSYITVNVEAENEDDALDKAWVECGHRTDDNDAVWDVESIEETK
jgi:hypothetical protein